MENASTVIQPPPLPQPQQPLPPRFLAASPLSFFDNATNGTTMGTPPPQLLIPKDNSNTTFFTPPAAFPDELRRVDLSPIEFILALMAVIMIPALIYAFIFLFKFPPWPNSHRNHHQSSDELSTDNSGGPGPCAGADRLPEPVPGIKYQRESHAKEIGSDCPVCLSVFADGEEVRQLSACKHAFHTTCIDLWLNSHSNCPICRASVAVKRPSARAAAPRRRDDNMNQGSPDAASLV